MKISELIEELNRLKDEHGDLEVKYPDDGGLYEVESVSLEGHNYTFPDPYIYIC